MGRYQQPQGAVQVESFVISAFVPRAAGLGYVYGQTSGPMGYHYSAASYLNKIGPLGYYLTTTGAYEDARGPAIKWGNIRASFTAVSYSFIASLASPISIMDGITVNANGSISISTETTYTTSAGIVTPGPCSIAVQMVSPTGSSSRDIEVWYNGRLVGSATGYSYYGNDSYIAKWSTFRSYGTPVHGPNSGMVFLTAICSGLMAKSLSTNPLHVFRRQTSVALLKSASVGGTSALAGDAAALASASGSLAVAVPLSGASVSVATATGQLSTALPLSGAAAAVASATGNLSVGIALSATALAQAIASGALSAAFPLGGGAVAQAAALGSLSIQFALSGAAVAQASATGSLNPGNSSSLAGNAQAQASASGTLSVNVPLAGNAQVVASASGSLGVGITLAGAAVAVTTAGGNLLVTVSLSGAALAQAIANGGLAVLVPLQGAAIAQASASGFLSGGDYVDYTDAPLGGGPVVLQLNTHRPANVVHAPAARPVNSRRPANAGGRRI